MTLREELERLCALPDTPQVLKTEGGVPVKTICRLALAALDAREALGMVVASAPEVCGDAKKPERTWRTSMSLDPVRAAIDSIDRAAREQ